MKVLVIGMNGVGLMPTTPRKARLRLKQHKAEVARKQPFTIRLKYKTGCATQHCDLGIDTGSQHIGVAIVSEDKVLRKDEWQLRSTMDKRKLMETRKTMRRGRRFRNTPYRHPKFKPHAKRVYSEKCVTRHKHKTHWIKAINSFASSHPKGWLAPSMQSKVDHHVRIINRYLAGLPKDTAVTLELGRFDMQKIKNPDISGVDYQHGRLYQYENIKAYLLDRQGYKCPICGKKFGAERADGTIVKARLHHINYRANGASDNPDELLMVCDHCHSAAEHAEGGELDKLRRMAKNKRGMRDMTAMNIVASRLRSAFPNAKITYGNITNADRKQLELPKTHANDAVAIAKHADIVKFGDCTLIDDDGTTLYGQYRKKKRSLHEANPRKGRKTPNRSAMRNAKNTKRIRNVCLLDSVIALGQKGVVTGFTGNACRVVNSDGEYITKSDKYTSIQISSVMAMHHNNNWIERWNYDEAKEQ